MATSRVLVSERRWRVFYKRLGTLVFQFLPSVCVLLMVYLMANFAVRGTEIFPHQHGHSYTYRFLCMTLSLGWFGFLLAASYAFGFCRLHREQITYLYLCALFVWIHRWWTLGSIAPLLSWFATGLGTYIIMVVVWRLIIKKNIRKFKLFKALRNGRNYRTIHTGSRCD